MRVVRVEVTSEDIEDAFAKKDWDWPEKCPIARAMTRSLGRQVTVGKSIGHNEAEWRYHGDGTFWALPSRASRFISRIDDDKRVSPFQFYLEVLP